MIFRFGLGKRKSKSWKEVREEIVQAIEKERLSRESISESSSAEKSDIDDWSKMSTGSTASEDSYPIEV